ncbi:MAG: hemerythrin family protein [Rhodospirillaceae bacterium]|nr:hemerythrin family protein [Rhodospirillaceae bacterium]MBL6941346.1 hemerythrin family protein [Rhodospirillales bacterium]
MSAMHIQWKDEYCVGNALIDYDHQTLVNITNELFACVDKGLSTEEISTVIKYLINYVELHFQREESLFQESDYPDGQAHMKKHREIEQVVRGISDQYAADPDAINIDDVMKFLKNWLINHIMRTDRSYVPFLNV